MLENIQDLVINLNPRYIKTTMQYHLYMSKEHIRFFKWLFIGISHPSLLSLVSDKTFSGFFILMIVFTTCKNWVHVNQPMKNIHSL